MPKLRLAPGLGTGSRRLLPPHPLRWRRRAYGPTGWRRAGSLPGGPGKSFVDLQTDTTAADIFIAAGEGYESIEHVKRYTTLGMGTDQGKTGAVNGVGVLAEALGAPLGEVGTTTFRQPYTPVTYGAIAGREVGELFDPVRKTAIHGWHVEAGAEFENVGQWKRPWYYPRPGESMDDAVNRECIAVRSSVGVLDASTLGKIDIKGPDAAKLLDRVYINGWRRLRVGRCRYGFMLGEDGMIMDDGVTAKLADDHYLMHTTSSGAAAVMAWLERWLQTEWPDLRVYMTSVTDHWATVSINGPYARKLLAKLCAGADLSNEAFPFMSVRDGVVAGVRARIFRVSFAGELSFEVNVDANYGRRVWEAVVEAGREFGVTPYGTEAMHVLRAREGLRDRGPGHRRIEHPRRHGGGGHGVEPQGLPWQALSQPPGHAARGQEAACGSADRWRRGASRRGPDRRGTVFRDASSDAGARYVELLQRQSRIPDRARGS